MRPMTTANPFIETNQPGRVDEARDFTLEQCNAGLAVPGLQKAVRLALERRIRALRWNEKTKSAA